MHDIYHGPRYGAIPLALLFMGGTGYVLFEDVLRHGAEITTAHIMTALALIGTIAAGHYALPEIRAGRVLSAVALIGLFLAGTLYIVTISGARNAETAAAKAAAVSYVNDERTRLEDERTRQQERLDKARQKVEDECGDGKGPKCDGKRATVTVYELAVAGVEAKLEKLDPPREVNAGYAHAGRIFAALTGGDAAAIAERLELLMPFAVVLISEIGTLVFTHMALAARPRRRVPVNDSRQTSFAPVEDLTPEPPPSRRRRTQNQVTAERRQRVASFVDAYRRQHGHDPEPRLVREATGLPRATAHRYQRAAG